MSNDFPRQYSIVTVVDNETGEKYTGNILEYTPEKITLRIEKYTNGTHGEFSRVSTIVFNAKKVHFE